MNKQTETYHTLEVWGVLWDSTRTTYSYRVSDAILSEKEAKRAAVDFQDLLDWRCVRSEHTYTNNGRGLFERTDRYVAVRGFRNGMYPRKFYRLANA